MILNLRYILFKLLLGVIVFHLTSSMVMAHGFVHDRLHEVDSEIKKRPDHANLYLRRGRIHYDAKHWNEAQADYYKALQLAPDFHEVVYWQGMLNLVQDRLDVAEEQFKIYLKYLPQSSTGYKALAQIYTSRNQFLKAADYYDTAIQLDEKPAPDLYLKRFKVLSQLNPIPKKRIISDLENAIKQHGELVTFLELLIEVKVSTGDYKSAWKDFKRFPESLRFSPLWQIRKGDLLAKAGYKKKALRVYKNLVESIDEMPKDRQKIKAIVQARKQAEQAVASLIRSSRVSNK